MDQMQRCPPPAATRRAEALLRAITSRLDDAAAALVARSEAADIAVTCDDSGEVG